MIRQIAAEMASKDRVVQLAPSVSDEALWVGTSPVDLKHLLRLLIEEAFLAWERATGAGPTMSIQTENVNAKARIRIVVQGAREKTDSAENGEASSEHESLLAATCRSLAVRLGATIHRERRAEGLCVIQVEFPLSLMRGS